MSCTDVQTIQAGNGTKTQFSFDFPYIFKSEIHVYFWNATTKEYDEKLTTDSTYPWRITDANPTIVEFTGTAPPAPATPVDPGESTVDNVKIRRITQIDDIRALFNPGSAIRSDDLNNNFEQLKYAIQEANCQGIPDDVDQYLKDYYWDRFDNTLYSADTWRSDDATIATTAALDQRFQDEVNETFTKAELAAASDVMPDNDVAVPTTGAVKDYIDHVVETDILVDGTGLNKTGSGGQVTLGISADSVDFDRIKDADKVQLADQEADYDLAGGDDKVFTASAAIRRFENYVQNTTPAGTGVGKGAVWVDVDDDLTLSVWNGSSWLGITSGGTFTNQPKVVYVDASSGDDSNDGHRISRPKATIKAAINQINLDSTYGDGSVVIVAAGVYQEAAPIQIQKKNVSIIGQALRSCIVHPTVATQGDQSSGNHALFELNSGSYIANLTLTGMKANNTGTNTVDSTLPSNQGWNFAFYNGATITKSPYIQNCTNFSDSEIDNSDLNANTPAGGLAGDTDSAPTGGGALIDGSVVDSASPLRSMVCDSYTHVGLNGPGILVTNNGYCQATSSYAFFNKYHIKCLNGGQANLAASTTDFGDQALVADGKSTTAIFTSNVDGAASDGDLTFNINEPTAGAGWFGDTERPATNMLVEVNSVIYPILSATANTDSEGGAGWTVTISRPNPNNRSENLGLNGAVSDNAAVSFYLRSMIASSGHTMEYVGSGTDYRALPENGGVPDETKQITESNNGKVWTAITDHNGKFKIGGNQTDDPIFEIDQQLGFVTIPEGSIAFNLLSDLTPQLGGDLDVNGNTITGLPTTPSSSTEATSKAYVDAQIAGIDEVVEDTTPQLGGNLDVNGNTITSASNGNVVIDPDGTGSIQLDANVGVGTASPDARIAVQRPSNNQGISGGISLKGQDGTTQGGIGTDGVNTNNLQILAAQGIYFHTGNTDGTTNIRAVIDSSGRVGIGTSSPSYQLDVKNPTTPGESWVRVDTASSTSDCGYRFAHGGTNHFVIGHNGTSDFLQFYDNIAGAERMRIDSSGRLGIGTTSPSAKLAIVASGNINGIEISPENSTDTNRILSFDRSTLTRTKLEIDSSEFFHTNNATETFRIDSSGNVGIGVSTISEGRLVIKQNADTSSGGFALYDSGAGSTFRIWRDGAGNNSVVHFDDRGTTNIALKNGNVGIGDTSPSTALHITNYDPVIRLEDLSSGNANIYAEIDANSASGNLFFDADPNNAGSSTVIGFKSDGTERMRIDSSGHVVLDSGNVIRAKTDTDYIGISGGDATNSGANMFLYGPSHSSDANNVLFRTGSSERMRIDSSGRVGIGTTFPGSWNANADNLVVGTTSGDNGITIASGTANQGSLFFSDSSTGSAQYAGYVQYDHSVDALLFGTQSNERMRIDSSGNVNIDSGVLRLNGSTNSIAADQATATRFRFTLNSLIAFDLQRISTTGAQLRGNQYGTGSSAASYPVFTNLDDANTGIFFPSADNLGITTGGTERMRILSSGGLTFNGDTAQANALDDYEEGTFTVTDNTSTVTFTSNRAHYVKIGAFIYVQFSINIPTTSSTTRLEMTLPFASSINGFYAGGGHVTYTNRNTTSSYMISVENNGSVCYVYEADDMSGTMTLADFSNKRLDIALTYYA